MKTTAMIITLLLWVAALSPIDAISSDPGHMVYRILYSLNFAPWERMADQPLAREISYFFDKIEKNTKKRKKKGNDCIVGPCSNGRRALDLGCGRGYWSIELARRGWDVTGVDIIERALRSARTRSQDAGVATQTRFLRGDITKLRKQRVFRKNIDLGMGDSSFNSNQFQLVLDFGAVHGLSVKRRRLVAEEVAALSSPGAYLLVVAARPPKTEEGKKKQWPQPSGMSREDIEHIYNKWLIVSTATNEEKSTKKNDKVPILDLYLLRKKT